MIAVCRHGTMLKRAPIHVSCAPRWWSGLKCSVSLRSLLRTARFDSKRRFHIRLETPISYSTRNADFMFGTGRFTMQPRVPASHSPIARCFGYISWTGWVCYAAGFLNAHFLEPFRWWPRKCGSANTGRLFRQRWRVAALHFSGACSISCYGLLRLLCIWCCFCWLVALQRWLSQHLLVTDRVLFPAFHRCLSLASEFAMCILLISASPCATCT
jgi:hypothetical protein